MNEDRVVVSGVVRHWDGLDRTGVGAAYVSALIASRKARKIPRSGAAPSASTRSSGCHCTPTSQAPLSASTPSISPSSLHAVATSPGARSRTAWWWRELTEQEDAPSAACRRLDTATLIR